MNLKKLLFFIIIILMYHKDMLGQEIKIHKITYGDTLFMLLQNDETNYWRLKIDGLQDGKWIVYYDKQKKDTAAMVTVLNGTFNGLYREWNRKDKYVSQKCIYVKGYRKDTCRDYVYFFHEYEGDGIPKDSILIEIYAYKCYNQNGDDVVGEEWIEYKTISLSAYEKATGVIRKKIVDKQKKQLISGKDTVIKFIPKILDGYITINIKEVNPGDHISFGEYDVNDSLEVLAYTNPAFTEDTLEQEYEIKDSIVGLFIKYPSNCVITYSLRKYEPPNTLPSSK